MRNLIISVLACSAASAAAAPWHLATHLDVVDSGHARLTLVASSQRGDAETLVASIPLPHGMTPTAMTLERNGLAPMTAERLRFDDARHDFDEIVRVIRDPALLEYIGPRRARLSVFPVRRGEPATIVIALTATSLVNAQSLAMLDADHSLIAHEPFVGADPVYEPYADYWPAHHDATK